mmetsp:Transcript_6088/g.8856  ORF Transcript_6088/g.8856 Transcript_6088/m.8856 type:complete len:488 (-) Transcript_6088:359-1822(-)
MGTAQSSGTSSSTHSKEHRDSITGEYSSIKNHYSIYPATLGQGSFGVVRKCMCRKTKNFFAVKSIRKSSITKLDCLRRETEILKEMKHPNIISLIDIYEDKKYLHLVTDLCTGGELFDRIIAKSTTGSQNHCFSEVDAAKLIHSILSAIAYCHDVKNIVHRDLKPENFLYETEDSDSPIKIIDFGLSRYDTSSGIMNTRVGTPFYIAPDVLIGEYTKSCDNWSIGVITYIVLCGYPPFFGDSDTAIFKSVISGKFSFPKSEWDSISDDAKNFISGLLQLDPNKRMTAAEAMNHEWIVQRVGKTESTNEPKNKEISNSSKERIDNFSSYLSVQKMKKKILGFITKHIPPSEVEKLGAMFKQMDLNNDGMLSLEEIESAIGEQCFQEIDDQLKNLKEELSLTGQTEINWKDFLRSIVEMSDLMKDDLIRLAFDHFKSSKGNQIQRYDLVKILGGESYASEILGAIDFDGDGAISYDEFRKIVEKETDLK